MGVVNELSGFKDLITDKKKCAKILSGGVNVAGESKEMRDAINEMLYNLRQTVHDEQLREEWVWRLERKLCDDNEVCLCVFLWCARAFLQ